MALARARQAARRTKDRWKSKVSYKILAPPAFNNAFLGETLADEPEKLAGRTVDVTLNELTGDMKQMHIKVTFQVESVQDFNVKTKFVGHDMTSDYTRRLTRRGNSKIPAVFDVQTQDGSRIRVKPFAVTDRRCQTTQAMGIRAAMGAALQESAAKHNLSGFLAEILLGELTNKMSKDVRKIHPVRRIEIAKSEIISAPTIVTDETPVIRMAEPAPAPEVIDQMAEVEAARAAKAAETPAETPAADE